MQGWYNIMQFKSTAICAALHALALLAYTQLQATASSLQSGLPSPWVQWSKSLALPSRSQSKLEQSEIIKCSLIWHEASTSCTSQTNKNLYPNGLLCFTAIPLHCIGLCSLCPVRSGRATKRSYLSLTGNLEAIARFHKISPNSLIPLLSHLHGSPPPKHQKCKYLIDCNILYASVILQLCLPGNNFQAGEWYVQRLIAYVYAVSCAETGTKMYQVDSMRFTRMMKLPFILFASKISWGVSGHGTIADRIRLAVRQISKNTSSAKHCGSRLQVNGNAFRCDLFRYPQLELGAEPKLHKPQKLSQRIYYPQTSGFLRLNFGSWSQARLRVSGLTVSIHLQMLTALLYPYPFYSQI